MENILKCLLLACMLLISSSQFAQVGIGTSFPDASAVLDLFSDDKGLLMPRLTEVEKGNITNPAKGLMVFNIVTNDIEVNVGTPIAPKWIGIKDIEDTMIYAITSGSDFTITPTAGLVASDLILSPSTGSFLASFNAQFSDASFTVTTFDSNIATGDLTSLYTDLMAYTATPIPHDPAFGSDETLSPGVYDISGATSIAGTLTLDGGTLIENPIFIIRGTGAFTTAAGTTVQLMGNAKAENIFWVSGSTMGLGANTTMKGTLLSGGVTAGAIALGVGVDLEGRVLTASGAITRGADDVIIVPVDNAPVNLGTLSSFAMWSSNGAVSDVSYAKTTGDVGTALGILTMVGTHVGEEYPAGTVSETIVNNSTTTYSIYVNGTEVPGSRRTINIKDGLISLEAMVTIASDNIPVELRWKVDKGSATLNNRIFSLSRSEY